MNLRVPFTARKLGRFRVSSLAKRVTFTFLVAATLLVGLAGSSNAQVDSFFDIWIDAWDSGQVVMQPVDSGGAFPFPPPPLDFPNVGAGGAIDIEMVSLSLHSSGPSIVSPPDPTSGQFTVDSFFDIEYDITASNGNDPATHAIDSFFDIAYSMEVRPGPLQTLPTGEEQQTFDIELVSLSLTSVQPIDLTGDPDFDFAIQLVEGFDPGLDGHVTVLKLAGGGNTFQVDSFFDIFVEISIDGGPPVSSLQDSQLRLAHSAIVPEPSTFGMLAFGLLAALLFTKRRRKN